MARFGGPGNFGGMGDLQKLMKQAQKMQEETAKLQEALPAARYSANAGGGMVTITVNGYGQLVEVKINPAIVDPADVEILEDLIVTAAKEAAAKRLMDYVTSPVCKTPLEEAISHTAHAHKNLLKEMEQHKKIWEERHTLYQTIHYDISHVRNNMERVLDGRDPLKLEKPKLEPLALPLQRDLS